MNFELGKLHQGVSYELYAAQPGLRASHLKDLMRSPAHFKQAQETHKEPSKALQLGKVVHGFIEEGEAFKDKYLIEPEFWGYTQKGERSNNCGESRQKKKDWYASIPKGAAVVTQAQQDQVVGILSAIGKNETLKNLLKNGMRESSGWVVDPLNKDVDEDGNEKDAILQFRPDFISEAGFIVDFKTTRDAREDFFLNEIFSYKWNSRYYVLQAAHYCYCAKLMGLKRPGELTYVAIESEAPHGIKIYPLNEYQVGFGEEKRAELTKLYYDCKRSGKWPAYAEKAVEVKIPYFLEQQFHNEDLY